MTFNKIDIKTWNRKEAYDHYLKAVPCTYSMTINLDITELISIVKRRELKFFPIMLYGIAHTVNHHAEFRMDLDEMQNLGYYSYSNPCYTVFHSKTETFTNVWTEYDADVDVFMKNYNADMLIYQNDFECSKPRVSNNLFNVSCIPWSSFTGFNLNLQQGYNYFPPIFTIGKYFSDGSKILLPLAIQVHHAVCDGFHLSRFINDLQKWIDAFDK